MVLPTGFQHENVKKSALWLVGKATRTAAARQLAGIIPVFAENLLGSANQNIANVCRIQVNIEQ